jgi:hypothetical protein
MDPPRVELGSQRCERCGLPLTYEPVMREQRVELRFPARRAGALPLSHSRDMELRGVGHAIQSTREAAPYMQRPEDDHPDLENAILASSHWTMTPTTCMPPPGIGPGPPVLQTGARTTYARAANERDVRELNPSQPVDGRPASPDASRPESKGERQDSNPHTPVHSRRLLPLSYAHRACRIARS